MPMEFGQSTGEGRSERNAFPGRNSAVPDLFTGKRPWRISVRLDLGARPAGGGACGIVGQF